MYEIVHIIAAWTEDSRENEAYCGLAGRHLRRTEEPYYRALGGRDICGNELPMCPKCVAVLNGTVRPRTEEI